MRLTYKDEVNSIEHFAHLDLVVNRPTPRLTLLAVEHGAFFIR
jgi:hypothetical protein